MTEQASRTMPILSICIPTLNRASYLEGLLKSIEIDLNGREKLQIELVIVDGGSQDQTRQIIGHHASQFNLIPFFRTERAGIDLDIMKCVEIATGEYCWLFSDDDRFEKNALSYVLDILERERNMVGIFCHRTPYDQALEKQVREVSSWPCHPGKRDEYIEGKSMCFKKIGMDFGFLSSQIIKRSAWNSVVNNYDPNPLNGCMYLMIDIMARMMNAESRWMMINKPLVKQRTGNDSILARSGFVKRHNIEHGGFRTILNNHYHSGDSEYRIFNTKIINRLPRAIAHMKAQNIDSRQLGQIYKIHIRYYSRYLRYWVKIIPIMMTPKIVFSFVKKMYFRYFVK